MEVPTHRLLSASLVALALVLPRPASAHSISASVIGTVVHQTRELVPGATVTLVNEDTGDRRVTTSNETGAFVFSSVRPGTYTVRVELAGFATFELQHRV